MRKDLAEAIIGMTGQMPVEVTLTAISNTMTRIGLPNHILMVGGADGTSIITQGITPKDTISVLEQIVAEMKAEQAKAEAAEAGQPHPAGEGEAVADPDDEECRECPERETCSLRGTASEAGSVSANPIREGVVKIVTAPTSKLTH